MVLLNQAIGTSSAQGRSARPVGPGGATLDGDPGKAGTPSAMSAGGRRGSGRSSGVATAGSPASVRRPQCLFCLAAQSTPSARLPLAAHSGRLSPSATLRHVRKARDDRPMISRV
jgi:hypothetical protein